MELLINACIAIVTLATIIGSILFVRQSHSYYGLWVFCIAGIFVVIGFCAGVHASWVKEDALVARNARPASDAGDKPDSMLRDDAKIAPSAPQSTQDADVLGAVLGNQPDTQSPAPVTDAPPPWENPTPEYIENTIKAAPDSARARVARKFIETPVSWDGRFSVISEGNDDSVMIRHGLRDSSSGPHFFYVPANTPENEFLLLLPKGAPLHVDGKIGSIQFGVISLKDVTAKVLRAAQQD